MVCEAYSEWTVDDFNDPVKAKQPNFYEKDTNGEIIKYQVMRFDGETEGLENVFRSTEDRWQKQKKNYSWVRDEFLEPLHACDFEVPFQVSILESRK